MSDRCQPDEPKSRTECQIIKLCVIGKAVKETGDVGPSEGRIERGPRGLRNLTRYEIKMKRLTFHNVL